MFVLFFKLLFIAVIIFLGMHIRKCTGSEYENFFSKIGRKTDYRAVRNYTGNMIMLAPFPCIIYLTHGAFRPHVYVAVALYFLATMVMHLHDMTGKPIDLIMPKLTFTEKQLRQNIFMRITLTMVVASIFSFFVMTKFVAPITGYHTETESESTPGNTEDNEEQID